MPLINETRTFAAPHNWHSNLFNFYIAQFGCGCERFAMGETDRMSMPAVQSDGYEMVDGMLWVPDAPGFGLQLNPDAFNRAQQDERAWWVTVQAV
jgi:L-alanine-DL-glutamate epimerase-like enolase superfamily enzyme